MKINKQTQEATDIVCDKKVVGTLSFTAYETGNLELYVTINGPQDFHNSEEAKNDMNDLIEAALQASKDKLSTYVAP